MAERRTYEDPFCRTLDFVDGNPLEAELSGLPLGLKRFRDMECCVWLLRDNERRLQGESFSRRKLATSRAFSPVSESCRSRSRNALLLTSLLYAICHLQNAVSNCTCARWCGLQNCDPSAVGLLQTGQVRCIGGRHWIVLRACQEARVLRLLEFEASSWRIGGVAHQSSLMIPLEVACLRY